MTIYPVKLVIILFISSFLACVLSLIELPDWLFYFRPDWLMLVVFYWVLALPRHIGLGYAFVNGLLLDIVLVKPLGMNAIGFTVLAYLISKIFSQIRVLVLWQQCVAIGVLIGLIKLLIAIVAVKFNDFVFTVYYWYSIVGNMAFWPIVYGVLRQVRRAFVMNEKN